MTCDTPDGTDITVPQRERERDANRPFAGGASASHSNGPDHLGPRPRVWPIEAPISRGRIVRHRTRELLDRSRGSYRPAKELKPIQPSDPAKHEEIHAAPISSGFAAHVVKALRSPILTNVGIAALLYVISFHPYFDLAGIVSGSLVCPGAKAILVATVDFLQEEVTPTIQAFLSGRLMRWIGLTLLFAFFPAFSVLRTGTMARIRALATSAASQVRRLRLSRRHIPSLQYAEPSEIRSPLVWNARPTTK
ncbi:hypothetical protein ACVIU7_004500 [Bradyrhizobium liaoningense]|nr:hypothetical protein GCM10007858_73000 [Bradyrhizobium liaoningense]